jgi:hypothetical protein
VSFATQTVFPVVEFEEQEFTVCAVATVTAGPPLPTPALVSIGTTFTPAGPPPQLPFGAYTVTFVPCTRIPNELEGKQASGASVGVAVGTIGVGVELGFGVGVDVGISVGVGVLMIITPLLPLSSQADSPVTPTRINMATINHFQRAFPAFRIECIIIPSPNGLHFVGRRTQPRCKSEAADLNCGHLVWS